MTTDETGVQNYQLRLGALIHNLLTLEAQMRQYLCLTGNVADWFPVAGMRTLPLSEFTRYDSLRPLLKQYNRTVKRNHPQYEVDFRVVEIRDGFAHGRIFPDSPGSPVPLRLMKFDKHAPTDTVVRVLRDELLTETLLDEYRDFVEQQGAKVELATAALANS